jgi:hypothetical protein
MQLQKPASMAERAETLEIKRQFKNRLAGRKADVAAISGGLSGKRAKAVEGVGPHHSLFVATVKTLQNRLDPHWDLIFRQWWPSLLISGPLMDLSNGSEWLRADLSVAQIEHGLTEAFEYNPNPSHSLVFHVLDAARRRIEHGLPPYGNSGRNLPKRSIEALKQ